LSRLRDNGILTHSFTFLSLNRERLMIKSGARIPIICFISLAFILIATGGAAQQFAKTPSPADYSKEPFIFEEVRTKVAFNDDGTFEQEELGRIRIQSQAGLQGYGTLRVPYASSFSTVEIRYVKVTKPDGRVVTTPPENVLDMPSEVTRSAPLYSDLKEKQIPVKAIEIGDVLEYSISTHLHTAIVPGQFWYEHDFSRIAIVLGEEFVVSFPREREVKVKSPAFQPVITEEGGRKVYTWRSTNLDRKATDDRLKAQSPLDIPPPDVQLTTFHDWNEIAKWFQGLAEGQANPTPEIRAKAEELTKGETSESDKLHSLYNFVSTKIRYVGIDFGIGRYKPHAAEDVLSNGYGDCKDKHTLLAALLAAENIQAFPAFVNSSRTIDADLPSPGQFDHVVTVVPSAGTKYWLDTTAEVAPFAYLISGLRGKKALEVPVREPGKLVETPADSPVPSSINFKIDGTLDKDGTLVAKIEVAFRGDYEVGLRQAFRNTSQSRWNEVIQNVSYAWGFAGVISDEKVSSPDKTDEPFHISYAYTRKDYPDWANHRITIPTPEPLLTPIGNDENAIQPVELGPRGEIHATADIAVPKGFTPVIPAPGHFTFKKDFVEYDSKYSESDGVLHAQRDVFILSQEVPSSRRSEYAQFQKSTSEDEFRYVPLADGTTATTSGGQYAEAMALYEQAREAYFRKDYEKTIELAKRSSEQKPPFAPAFRFLASLYSTRDQDEEALDSWRQFEKLEPNDQSAPPAIGALLLKLKRPGEAVPELEAATEKFPKNSTLALELGQAYLRSGNSEKAVSAFRRMKELDTSVSMLETAAKELTDANVGLDDALGFVQKAVEEEEDLSTRTSLTKLTTDDIRLAQELGTLWDTLGWAYFRLGRVGEAEKNVKAAWTFTQKGLIGDHLGQIYEKEGKKQEAAHAYALAVATGGPGLDPALDSVQRLMGGVTRGDDAAIAARTELIHLRTYRMTLLTKTKASAEFYLLFTQGVPAPEIKFISGSDALRNADKPIADLKFDVLFPDNHPAKLLRRAILSCEPSAARCDLSLMTPDMVHKVD
jgi:tetratricopeptide (TPR) repeat protein/transglutaminase-like putative cysteine protease